MKAIKKLESQTFVKENAAIRKRNFSGKNPGKFDAEGTRNFWLMLTKTEADSLADAGWNVKTLPARDENEDDIYFINVAVRYDNFPPKIYLVTNRKKTLLDENTVGLLDTADIANIDITVNGSAWENHNGCGIKAYVKNMYVTINQVSYEAKYDDIPEDDQYTMPEYPVEEDPSYYGN